MAPRGRGRPRKPSRMDAAVDAMSPMGFSRQLVVSKMNQLLKEYGGDVGYAFIEAEAYKVLLDAILADGGEESKLENHSSKISAEGETSVKNDLMENEMVGDHAALAITAGPSSGNVVPKGSQTPNTATKSDSRALGYENSWKDIVLDETTHNQDMRIVEAIHSISGYSAGDSHLIDNDPPVGSPLLLTAGSSTTSPRKRRKPCYGWISDGEEDDNFVVLTPAVAPPVITPSSPVHKKTLSNEPPYYPQPSFINKVISPV